MSKPIHPSELPSTEEIIEPLRKLLDYLRQNRNGDWEAIPQYVALRKLLSDLSAHEFLWTIELAIAEALHGPCPQFKRTRHPRCDDFDQVIEELKQLAKSGSGYNDELRFQQARNTLMEDAEIALRAPASLKTAVSLRAFQEKINLAMGDCVDESIWSSVIDYDEFSYLAEWLQGSLVRGSPEWIADATWHIKRRMEEIWITMHTIGRMRKAVEARVHPRASREHWNRFIETEFNEVSSWVHALDIAQQAWEALSSRDKLTERKNQTDQEQKGQPTKPKTGRRASR